MAEAMGFVGALALLAGATPAIIDQAGPHVLVPGPVVTRALTYGGEMRQGLELFTRKAAGRAPVVVYLHGGGWIAGSPRAGSSGAQADHFTARGFAYATIGYRFVPQVTVEEQLADVARGIAVLRRQKGVDPERIVLIAHSSGGHLAALLGTDQSWLETAGVPFAALKAVVLLDPTGLDLPPILAGRDGVVEKYFRPTFGDDPARQARLSPVAHAEAPYAPEWAMLHDVKNGLSGLQSRQLAGLLIAAGGAEPLVLGLEGTDHMRLNGEIGRPGDAATAAIDGFLARVFPETQVARLR